MTIELARGLDGVPDLKAILANPRTRDVWTKADRRLLDRVAKLATEHGVGFALTCANQACPERKMRLHADASAPGGIVLRCGCTDRHFSRDF